MGDKRDLRVEECIHQSKSSTSITFAHTSLDNYYFKGHSKVLPSPHGEQPAREGLQGSKPGRVQPNVRVDLKGHTLGHVPRPPPLPLIPALAANGSL